MCQNSNCIPSRNNIHIHLFSELSCLPSNTSPIVRNADRIVDE